MRDFLMRFVSRNTNDIFFYLTAFVIFFSFLAYSFLSDNGLLKLFQLKATKEKVHQENIEIMRETLEYRLYQAKLHDIKFLEYQSRDSLGYVYPDEIVYIVE